MDVYVIGAGISKSAGYPLGLELFDEVDNFVRAHAPSFNRFQYKTDWNNLCSWLESNPNPLIAEAYRIRHMEYLFSILDIAPMMTADNLSSVFAASKKDAASVEEAQRTYEYSRYRRILLWALEAYLGYKHDQDAKKGKVPEALITFSRKVRAGDVVITFNYDSTLERTFLIEKKWSVHDGYGFEIVLRGPRSERLEVPNSPVVILHLHGATGWYRKPSFIPEHQPGSGAVSREAFGPAPLETKIALDPTFLLRLGVKGRDASLPLTPPADRQVFLHPSFFKDYEMEDSDNTVFI